ncbi:GNAT family N-acetyltransferase [Engelhardtia mirabilis]|uniref:N-acetyltransferase domain-containing protein n=1 Tax=Engelhardtia mirabilis TaxID=2528011 RepID=A0A518BF00_9BACT|nr:hypothetical protein Pla133_05280 [Planctomycetes bacterium Pla133]QDU99789.1 hypothetical protein Pla86_05280 [Planctomycetes bacterium Pla86]
MAEPGDEQRIFDAYAHLFEGDVDAPAPSPPTAATWTWRQAANPAGARVLLALDADEVVGLVCASGQPVLVNGEAARISRVDDIRIAPRFRHALGRPGLVVRMGEAWERAFGGMELDLISWGFPTPAAWRVLNWHVKVQAVRTQFKLVGQLEHLRIGEAGGLVAEPVERFDDDVEPLCARLAEGRGLTLARDVVWLDWRFRQRPDQSYDQAVVRRGGEVVGLAVFRTGDFDGDRNVGLVCDWIVAPDDDGAANALLAWLAERARAAGCERLVLLLPETSPDWRPLQDRHGFLALRLAKRFLLADRSYAKQMRMHWLHQSWHYTFADTDFA